MGIEKLDYFVCAAKYRNFTRAARECGVAQSAISQQISSLEADMDCKLFKRNGRSVELTPQGEELFESARRIQNLYEQAVHRAKSVAFAKEEQQLCIGIPGLESASLLRSYLNKWKQAFPQMEVKLLRYSPEYCRRELDQRLYDAILCCWTVQDEGKDYAYRELGSSPLHVLISQGSPLAKRPGLSFEQILDEADKLYLSYDILQQLQGQGLLLDKDKNKEKVHCFHDPDMLLPMGSINRAVVLAAHVPAALPDDMVEYVSSTATPQLREILLYRRQDRGRFLGDMKKE